MYYTVIKNRDEKEVVNDEYENDYINFKDTITPNHYIGRKNNNEILRLRNLYLTKEKIEISDKSFQNFILYE